MNTKRMDPIIAKPRDATSVEKLLDVNIRFCYGSCGAQCRTYPHGPWERLDDTSIDEKFKGAGVWGVNVSV